MVHECAGAGISNVANRQGKSLLATTREPRLAGSACNGAWVPLIEGIDLCCQFLTTWEVEV